MPELDSDIAQKIRTKIVMDMKPSIFLVYFKCGVAALVGGALSLLFSGQFGIGITHFAAHFQQRMHGHSYDLASAVLCGVAFSLLPPVILRLLCSGIQFRVIVGQRFHAGTVWLVGFGMVLSHQGTVGSGVLYLAVWSIAVAATFKLLTVFLDRLSDFIPSTEVKSVQ